MVALMGFFNLFHALFAIVVHDVGRHVMECVGVAPVC